MLFNSIEFLFFFPIVVLLYFTLNYKYRWLLLLVASYIFYMAWEPSYILLIIFSTIVDYFTGIKIEESTSKKTKRRFLLLSLLVNLGVLFFFKYFNFFNASITALAEYMGIGFSIPTLQVLLPVGISFYTFQTLSYTIEVYQGNQKAERHLGRFALYVSFFPQLVAGPIERSTNLIPQLRKHFDFDYQRITSGLKLMAWGMFKKVVIADRLAIVVDSVYNFPEEAQSLALLIGTVFFAFQIFCDFSGYSDIAIGIALVLGITLMENFKRPYHAHSVSDFWKRWHISLSTWFRDYLYIPLGGNRVKIPRWYANLFIVFLVSGLWHGANWTFVVWGALHGFYLVFAIISQSYRNKVNTFLGLNKNKKSFKTLQILITFVLVNFAWIFFRANNIGDATYIISYLFNDLQLTWQYIEKNITFLGVSSIDLIINCLLILFLETIHIIQTKGSIRKRLAMEPSYIRWSVYYGIIITIILLGEFSTSQFIYFQF